MTKGLSFLVPLKRPLTQIVNCGGGQGLTHRNRKSKSSIEFNWVYDTEPVDLAQDVEVKFEYTVVQVRDV